MRQPIHFLFAALGLAAIGSLGFLIYTAAGGAATLGTPATRPRREPLPRASYAAEPIGWSDQDRPAVTDLAVADLDADGMLDLVVCDAAANRVGWIRQAPRGTWTERWIGESVYAPARLQIADVNADGRLDVVVACRGRGEATEDLVGAVVALEQDAEHRFVGRTLLDHVAPVVDVAVLSRTAAPGTTVVAATAMADRGDVWWLDLDASGEVRKQAFSLEGEIVALAELRRSGERVAVAVLEAADRDRMVVLIREGTTVTRRAGWTAPTEDWAGCRLMPVPATPGAPALVLVNGDRLGEYTSPRPWHGVRAVLHDGADVATEAVGLLPGCRAVASADLEGDGDLDWVGVSAGNQPLDPDAVWLCEWRNDGHGHYEPVAISTGVEPYGAVAVADLDGNGAPVIVTGAYHRAPQTDRPARVLLWRRTSP